MAPDRIEFGREDADDVDQGLNQASVDSQNVGRIEVRGSLEFTVRQGERHLVSQGVVDSLNGIARVITRFRHEADANRSGGERQGSLGGEPASQLRKDRQVGVEPDPIQATDTQREQRPLVLSTRGLDLSLSQASCPTN